MHVGAAHVELDRAVERLFRVRSAARAIARFEQDDRVLARDAEVARGHDPGHPGPDHRDVEGVLRVEDLVDHDGRALALFFSLLCPGCLRKYSV